MFLLNRLEKLLYMGTLLTLAFCLSGCTESNSAKGYNPLSNGQIEETGLNSRGEDEEHNYSPILAIISDKTIVSPSAEVDLRADALDPAGGILDIQWSSTTGTITENHGSRIKWQAPSFSTSAIINCVATAQNGNIALATATIEVLGTGIYRLVIKADRNSFLASRVTANSSEDTIPLSGALVSLVDLNLAEVSDSRGIIEIPIENALVNLKTTEILVRYLDWEISYNANLESESGEVSDCISFQPGYEGVSIAIATGDSFSAKQGMVEISAFENAYGEFSKIKDANVRVGSSEDLITDSNALLMISNYGDNNFSINCGGYQSIENYQVPTFMDSLTLIRAKLTRNGNPVDSDATISFIKPYNYQDNFSITSPFEIGFGQPMNRSSIFSNMSLVIRNLDTDLLILLEGSDIEYFFTITWLSDTHLSLMPKIKLQAETRYSISISEWNAETLDGRTLKKYDGMYGEFKTVNDPVPVILSSYPTNGTVGISRSGPFILNFSSSMDPSSLKKNLEIEVEKYDTGTKITINGSSLDVFFDIKWKNNNKTLELVPVQTLQANQTYIIRLKKSALFSETGKKIEDIDNLWGQFKTGGL